MKQKLITGLVALFIIALIVVFISPAYREGEPSVHGQPAKDFTFTMNGKTTRLSDLRGHVVVLNFWASWCQPCVEEAASLNALQQRISAMGGTILAVDVDIAPENQAAYEKFLKDNSILYPTYLDTSQKIAASYGTTMYPETYIISPDGKLDRKIIGPQDWSSPEMVSYIASLTTNKKSAATQESSLLP